MNYAKRMAALVLCAAVLVSFPWVIVALATSSVQENSAVVTPTNVTVQPTTPTDVVVTPTDLLQEEEQEMGEITTELIAAVCEEFNLLPGNYWSVQEAGEGEYSTRIGTVADDLLGNEYPANGVDYKFCNYQNQYECHGFACYVMAKGITKLTGTPTEVVPRSGDQNGWVRLDPDQVNHLQVGDIVRVESDRYQHSAVVYSVDEQGRVAFLESAGLTAGQIRCGRGFNHEECNDTLEKIRTEYQLEYVYRYIGE